MNNPLVHYALRHLSVKTNHCSRQKFEHGYELAPRTVPDYNLIFTLRGQVVWVIDAKPWEMRAGDLVIVPPHVIHHGFSRTRRMTLGSAHVEVRLPGGQDVFAMLNPPRFRHAPRDSHLDRYLRGFIEEFDRRANEEISLMLPGWCHLIVRGLIQHDAQNGLLRPRVAVPLVANLLEELDRRISRPVTLSDLALRSGYSPQHLNRIFRRTLGMTPLQYLLRMRLERAAVLLQEGRMTVNALAQEVGFEDAYYFSRLFKQHYGQSPVQYQAAMEALAKL